MYLYKNTRSRKQINTEILTIDNLIEEKKIIIINNKKIVKNDILEIHNFDNIIKTKKSILSKLYDNIKFDEIITLNNNIKSDERPILKYKPKLKKKIDIISIQTNEIKIIKENNNEIKKEINELNDVIKNENENINSLITLKQSIIYQNKMKNIHNIVIKKTKCQQEIIIYDKILKNLPINELNDYKSFALNYKV
jgi:hypothetical protein